jgi:hypothetical protein
LLRQQLDLNKHIDPQLDKPVLPPAETAAAGDAPLASEALRRPHPTSAAAMHPTPAAAPDPEASPAPAPVEPTQGP